MASVAQRDYAVNGVPMRRANGQATENKRKILVCERTVDLILDHAEKLFAEGFGREEASLIIRRRLNYRVDQRTIDEVCITALVAERRARRAERLAHRSAEDIGREAYRDVMEERIA